MKMYEDVLEQFDLLEEQLDTAIYTLELIQQEKGTDQRKLAIAKTNIEQGSLWIKEAHNRYENYATE